MLVGAIVAVKAIDLKQILAYSTISALGLLVMSLGHGGADASAAAVAFLLAHAIYKGALFLVAGSIDHGAGTRDVRLLSGLGRSMPVTMAAAICAALSMAAVAPFFGFIAKELLYAATTEGPAALIVTGVTMVASALFIVIAAMVGLRPFVGQPSDAARKSHEVPFSIWLGPVLLAATGLVLGLVPTLVDAPLLAPATHAILNATTPERLKLALWHGVNLPLVLSVVTIAVGAALFFVRGKLADVVRRLDWGGMSTVYERSLRGMLWVSERQTRFLQSGYLRYYLATLFVSLVAVVGYTVFVHERQRPSLPVLDISIYELAVCLLIPIGCWATLRTTSRIAAIVSLGAVGYAMALLFVIYGAPDLAMTQFLVETLTVVLFVFAFYRLPRECPSSPRPARIRDCLIAGSVGGLMAGLMLLSTVDQPLREVSNYYIEHSVPDAHGRNIVNVILVDFRALDTLGEITVLALAAAGVYSLIMLRPAEKP
jgi:multicomponent Na+:H+ antiporter subunit A